MALIGGTAVIAGIIIGPYGLAAFGTPESIIPVSELGVVMLLFLIGLSVSFLWLFEG